MEKKWTLLKASDGARGAAGKKKIYEVWVRDNVLVCEWGMAEKRQRQHSTAVFASHQGAVSAAYDKVWSKVDRGYAVAFTA